MGGRRKNNRETTDGVLLRDILSDIELLISSVRCPATKYTFLARAQWIAGCFYRPRRRGNNVLPDN